MDEGVRDRRGLAVLATGHLWADFLQGAIPALLPFLIAERGYSYAAAGALVLASSVGSSLVQPLFGIASDRLALPWLMPAGLALGGAGLALVGLTESYPATVAAVAVSGLGVAAFHPEGARYANYVSRGQRGRGMSMFSLGGNAGFALGPLLVTPAVLAFGLHGTLLALIPLWLAAGLLVARAGAAADVRARRAGRGGQGNGHARARPGRAVRAPGQRRRAALGRVLRPAGVRPDLLRARARDDRGGGQRGAQRDAGGGRRRHLRRRAARRPARAARDRGRLDGRRSARCSSCSCSWGAGRRRRCWWRSAFVVIANFSITVVMGQEYLPNRLGLAVGDHAWAPRSASAASPRRGSARWPTRRASTRDVDDRARAVLSRCCSRGRCRRPSTTASCGPRNTKAPLKRGPQCRSWITANYFVPGLCVLPGRRDTLDRLDRPPAVVGRRVATAGAPCGLPGRVGDPPCDQAYRPGWAISRACSRTAASGAGAACDAVAQVGDAGALDHLGVLELHVALRCRRSRACPRPSRAGRR